MDNGKGTVVVVDDDTGILEMISVLLRSRGHRVHTFPDAASALEALAESPPDLVLTDIYMPRMSGISLLSRFRAFDQLTPVILMTGGSDFESAALAVRLRAFDLLLKPFPPLQLALAVEQGILAKRELVEGRTLKQELEGLLRDHPYLPNGTCPQEDGISLEIIQRLSAAAELRDDETGQHISRIGSYSAIVAQALGMPGSFCRMISVAATMHDIGKIGIPDAILLKPGPLTAAEFQVLKRHPVIGEQILSNSAHPLLQMAAAIALSHHERWDGSGYPFGLAGEEIPLAARIVMIADQYDALRSRRPYKAGLDHDASCAVILQGGGTTRPGHFDPCVLSAFRENSSRFRDAFEAEHALPGRRGGSARSALSSSHGGPPPFLCNAS